MISESYLSAMQITSPPGRYWQSRAALKPCGCDSGLYEENVSDYSVSAVGREGQVETVKYSDVITPETCCACIHNTDLQISHRCFHTGTWLSVCSIVTIKKLPSVIIWGVNTQLDSPGQRSQKSFYLFSLPVSQRQDELQTNKTTSSNRMDKNNPFMCKVFLCDQHVTNVWPIYDQYLINI